MATPYIRRAFSSETRHCSYLSRVSHQLQSVFSSLSARVCVFVSLSFSLLIRNKDWRTASQRPLSRHAAPLLVRQPPAVIYTVNNNEIGNSDCDPKTQRTLNEIQTAIQCVSTVTLDANKRGVCIYNHNFCNNLLHWRLNCSLNCLLKTAMISRLLLMYCFKAAKVNEVAAVYSLNGN